MTAVPAALLAAWGALVWSAYWPPFAFPPAQAWLALSAQGLPLDPGELAAAIAGHFGRLAVALLVLLAARGFGRRAGDLAGVRGPGVVASLPLGLLGAGGAGLGLGLVGLWQPPVLWAVLALGVLAGGRPRDLAPFAPGTNRWALALVAAVAVPAGMAALAPEVTYDALAYHLGAPEQFLKLHRIVRFDHMMFCDFPLTLQMTYGFALAAGGGPGAAKLVHFLVGLAALGAASRLARRAGGDRVADWTIAGLAATPFLTTQMGRANVDLGVMLLTTAGAWWLLGPGRRAALVAGLCLGGAAAVKLTGGYGLVAAAVVLSRSGRAGRGRLLPLLAAGAVPLAPWLARSWIASGNPVYPFAYGSLGGLGWSAANAAIYRSDMTGPTSFNLQYGHAIDWLAAPWQMIMHDRGGEAAFGPLALMLLPVLWLVRPGSAAPLAWFAGADWLLWLATARDPRFFLPAWPVVCVLTALVLTRLARRPGAVVRGAAVLAAGFAPFYAAALTYRTVNPGPVVWGAIPRELYLDRLIPPGGRLRPMLRRASAVLGRAERVLVVGDVKAPGLAPVARYPSLFDTPPLAAWTRETPSAERLGIRCRQEGVTAFLYNVGGAVYLKRQFGHFTFTPPEAARLKAFLRRLVPLDEWRDADGDLALGLYRLGPPDPRRRLPLPGDPR